MVFDSTLSRISDHYSTYYSVLNNSRISNIFWIARRVRVICRSLMNTNKKCHFLSELPETSSLNSGGKFKCRSLSKLTRENSIPVTPISVSAKPVSNQNLGDDSQRSSISSASGQSVSTQCTTTAHVKTMLVKKSSLSEEDEGIVLRPLIPPNDSDQQLNDTSFV